MNKTAAEMVSDAKERIENLSVMQVAEEIETKEGDVLLVDLRERVELQQTGLIPGSMNVPRGVLEFWADPSSTNHNGEFQPGRRIILHCASGGRSALAADTLQKMGFERVAHMDGGFNAWKESGQPIVYIDQYWDSLDSK